MTHTQTAAQAPGGRTAGYRLVVPGGWFAIDLDPGRRDRAVTAADLAGSLDGRGRQVQVTDLPAGTAVRVLWRTPPGNDASATLEVFVPVPRGAGWLLLAFSAPLGPLAPAMTKLFDAIAATLRWDQ
jgi:hypothetical protein